MRVQVGEQECEAMSMRGIITAPVEEKEGFRRALLDAEEKPQPNELASAEKPWKGSRLRFFWRGTSTPSTKSEMTRHRSCVRSMRLGSCIALSIIYKLFTV